jgi:hypothetical protein
VSTCEVINMFVDHVLNTCVVCYASPAVEAVPARTISVPRAGWDASAYSQTRLDGDLKLTFNVPSSVGVITGLATERRSNDPRDVPWAFYVWKSGGAEKWAVSEAGVLKTTPVVRVPETDVFRIERCNGTVTYLHNNLIVYVSEANSLGSLVAVTCLYASGDGVG